MALIAPWLRIFALYKQNEKTDLVVTKALQSMQEPADEHRQIGEYKEVAGQHWSAGQAILSTSTN